MQKKLLQEGRIVRIIFILFYFEMQRKMFLQKPNIYLKLYNFNPVGIFMPAIFLGLPSLYFSRNGSLELYGR